MPKRTAAYKPWVIERLKNPKIAAAYLNAASRESLPAFLKALRKVAEAHQMSKVAKAAGVQRESLYRMLREQGNPEINSLWAVGETMGLRVTVEPITEASPPAEAAVSLYAALTHGMAAYHMANPNSGISNPPGAVLYTPAGMGYVNQASHVNVMEPRVQPDIASVIPGAFLAAHLNSPKEPQCSGVI